MLFTPLVSRYRCNQKPSRPSSYQLNTVTSLAKPKRILACSISRFRLSRLRALMFFNRGACPRPIVKPNFHSASLNSSARYSFVEIGVSFCLRVVFGTISSSFLNWSLPHHPGVLPEKRPACAFLTYYLYL